MTQTQQQDRQRKPRRDNRRQFDEVPKEYQEELLEVRRVTRVTAGGRQLRFRAAVSRHPCVHRAHGRERLA